MAERELTKKITRTKTPKAFEDGSNFMMVAAIDFGTTYSGYAFSLTSAPNEVKANATWGSEVGATRYKTPSCVLADNSNNLIAFGYEAQTMYAEDDDAKTKYQMYDRFKMNLYKEKVIGAKTTITSRAGHIISADVVISYALRYLHNHILKTLKAFNAGKINTKKIRWVLTVPAIWSESAKQMMRRAAWHAGIIESLTSKRLKIALEPEAASFWCRDLPIDKFQCGKDDEKPSSMPDETTYMVVDCGGGTIDITVHEVDFDGTVKEVYRASGGNWGGTCVDEQFIKVLEDTLGKEFMRQYQKDYPQEWLEFFEIFETKKRSCGRDKKGLRIQLPYGLGEAIQIKKGKSVNDAINGAQVPGVSFKQGLIVLDQNVAENMFLPSINQIVEHVKELLTKPQVADSKYLFMVGGYSDCAILQEKVKTNFGSMLQIMIPEDPGMCVMKGAVLFGHYPDTVTSRVARKTYGQIMRYVFEEGKHDPSKKVIVDGVAKCDYIFKVWVKKDEVIKTDETRTFTCIPSSADHTEIDIGIYESENDASDITYVTDPGVKHIGTLKINVPDKHLPRLERVVKTQVYFGSTEIYVHARDTARENGDTAETNIDFLCQ